MNALTVEQTRENNRIKARRYWANNREKINANKRRWRKAHPEKVQAETKARKARGLRQSEATKANRRLKHQEFRKNNLEQFLLIYAKKRAKRSGMEFNIALDDVVIPDVCPLLGIRITPGNEVLYAPSNPSLDRIDSSKGYVKGNVWVISLRANTLKNSAGVEELETLLKNMKEKIA